ncbi:hypothetical protein PPL_01891 [Heterostelium album PN500]|uniref:Uncharacterized protein n=1 Tax=Heterostelium pallidum (strain ATCC 26659 / Pp 5 / PN500) TaxID=670386 RepID=D3B0S4_HETP5|nr:hypothetical protein PPL_01891 [Heterostelium album PN500]EFA84898.1 hypothetical protein PPL_01891 [Heterostelium album PN500]|eukprot:XP_020437008.1 hypothetical protein PPL_01891 [Heterostelium album PN500]
MTADNRKVFEMLGQLPRLTSLDITSVRINRIKELTHIIPSTIRRLKLPQFISNNSDILSIGSEISTFGISELMLEQMKVISDQLKNITKFIVRDIQSMDVKEQLTKLLCSPECKINTFYSNNCSDWVKKMLITNRTIETLDIGEDLEATYKVAMISPGVKRIIFHSYGYQSMNYTKTESPTGYILIKSKYQYIDVSMGRIATYAKKMYDVSDNTDDNLVIEATHPNLKFLYYTKLTILKKDFK